MNVDAHDKPDVSGVDRGALAVRESASISESADFAVVVPRSAWGAMHQHARERLDVEVGGVLVGRTFLSQHATPYLLIDAIVPALAAESRETNITFTGEAWTRIHEVIDRDHPDAAIVGWYHTHPAFGIFLSEMDVFICRHFFDLPHQIAIVIDPIAKSHGCFVWRGGVPTLAPMMIEPDDTPAGSTAVTAIKPADSAATVPAPAEDAHRPTPPRPVSSRAFSWLDPLARLDRTQWLALAGLIMLGAIVFGALLVMWLDISPSQAITRLRTLVSNLTQGGSRL